MEYNQIPEGYQLDPNSGLYYKESLQTSEDGRKFRHIYWFNGQTGEYSQQSYPIVNPQAMPVMPIIMPQAEPVMPINIPQAEPIKKKSSILKVLLVLIPLLAVVIFAVFWYGKSKEDSSDEQVVLELEAEGSTILENSLETKEASDSTESTSEQLEESRETSEESSDTIENSSEEVEEKNKLSDEDRESARSDNNTSGKEVTPEMSVDLILTYVKDLGETSNSIFEVYDDSQKQVFKDYYYDFDLTGDLTGDIVGDLDYDEERLTAIEDSINTLLNTFKEGFSQIDYTLNGSEKYGKEAIVFMHLYSIFIL